MRVSLLTALLLPSTLHAAHFRPDLGKMSPVICRENQISLGELEIFDAQIELAMVEAGSNLALFAEDFAEDNKHRGFGYGTCKDGRQWVISTPAPASVLQWSRDKKALTIGVGSMAQYCKTYDLDAIVSGQMQPKSLAKNTDLALADKLLNVRGENYLSVSLTCHPPQKFEQGAELWALIELQPQRESIPSLHSVSDLLEWIQDQRRKEQLMPLKSDSKPLQTVVERAAAQQDLHHPRAMLLSEKLKLKSQNIILLGENRASANSFSGLARLLWNSPQHRRLLLHPKANLVAFHTSQRQGEKLLVMLLARQ